MGSRSYSRDSMGRFAPSGGGGSSKKAPKGRKMKSKGKMIRVGVPITFRGFSASQMRKMFPSKRK